ncbi:helix-turn-helix domain-containing protein [Amycolatopsis sp. NPDC059021]|uniref:helix-turn-helix domain-containing protein n=1 Tax=Amycolatopsis sp. NPDC059021 TaxID=3346704 RepID=UPI00366BDF47
MKPTSSTPCAKALAAALRGEREARGVSLRATAHAIDVDPGMLSFWERALRTPSVADVGMLLGFLQVRREKRERILLLLQHVYDTDWLAPGVAELPEELTGLLEAEKTATTVTNWENDIIPGLLQTADYARALLNESFMSLDEADAVLITRLNRQKILTQNDPIQLDAIISERTIRDPVGSTGVMSDQIDHLLEVSTLPNVTLRILPTGIGYHPGRMGPFMIYRYDASQPVVFLEHYRGSGFLSNEKDVADYLDLAEILDRKALSEDASRELLAEVLR